MQFHWKENKWASGRVLLSNLIVISLILTGIIPALDNAIAAPSVEKINATTTGWFDSFDNESKINNISISGGKASLAGSFNETFDGLDWTKYGMVMDNGDAYETNYAYVPSVINDNGVYKMWYQGYDGHGRVLYASSSDGISWTKHGIALDTGGIYDSDFVGGPCVLKVGDEYCMWYHGNDGSNSRILFANSSDGITWQKQGMALDVGGAGEDLYLWEPTVIIDSDGSYKMWYTGNVATRNIFLATSPDGLSWTKQGQVLAYGALYEEDGIYAPTVIKHQSVYHMWYSGKDGSGRTRILYATSIDGISWTKSGLSVNYGSYVEETDSVDSCAVLLDGEYLKMWYTGSDWLPTHNSRIMYASTPLKMSWEKQGIAIDLGTGGSDDDTWTTSNCVIKDGTTYKMWYTGYDGSNYRIMCATSADASTWSKQGTVLDLGSGTENTHVGSPYVIKDGATYKMWYSGHDGIRYRIHYATSVDGIAWSRQGMVIDIGTAGESDDNAVSSPSVLKEQDGTYKLWYCGDAGGDTYKIHYATSPDGITWSKQGVVVPLGAFGDYDDVGTLAPNVIKYNGEYLMWYQGCPLIGDHYILHASSSDGVNWVKKGLAISLGTAGESDDDRHISPFVMMDNDGYAKLWYTGNDGSTYRIHEARTSILFDPLLWYKQGVVVDTNTSDDLNNARAPSIIKDGNTYKMWYQGDDGAAHRILYATSVDGISWNKKGIVLDIGGLYDSARAQSPCVIKDGSTYKIWYSGYDGVNIRILYATSPDGENWTKQGLVLDIGGTGETVSVHSSHVMIDDGIYKMWYTGYDGSSHDIFYATSADGITWAKQGLILGHGDLYEESGIRAPFVLKIDGYYQMWYGGISSSFSRIRILHATSLDGITWTKNGLALDFGDEVGEDETAFEPYIIQDNNLMKMWYTGIDWIPTNKARILYATTPTFRESAGQIISTPINLSAGNEWTSVNLTKEESYGNVITITVLNASSGAPIPGFVGLSGSNINITGIDEVIYPVIQLQANFTGNGGATPTLQKWWVNWTSTVDITPPEITDLTTGTPSTGDGFTVAATITDYIAVDEAFVMYYFTTVSGNTAVQNISMNDLGGGSYDYPISVPLDALFLCYNISANDTSNNWNETGMNVLAVDDTILPEITDNTTGIPSTGLNFTLSANVTDNINASATFFNYQFENAVWTSPWFNVSANFTGGITYEYIVSILTNSTIFRYYVVASDNSSNWNSSSIIDLAVTDIIIPEIFGLNSTIPATSEAYTITATIADNIAVDDVFVMYYFSTVAGNTTIQNISMNYIGNVSYEFNVSVPSDALFLFYNISAIDTSNNWNETGLQTLSVNDTLLPSIIDMTTGNASTGQDFNVTALVVDNVNVSSVNICYQFESTGWTSSWANISMENPSANNYNYAIPVMENATLLRYYIFSNDSSGNWNTSSQVELAVNDTIAPEIQDMTTGTPVTGEDYEIIINFSDNIEEDYIRIYVYYELAVGNSTPQNIQLSKVNGNIYNTTISIPLNAINLFYSAMANDTSNNWNLTDVISRDISDNQAPVASYPSNIIVNMGGPFVLDGSNSTDNIGIVNYSWMFSYGDQIIELYGMETSFNFTLAGNFNITFTVIDADNNWDIKTFKAQVIDTVFPVSDPGLEFQFPVQGEAYTFDGTDSWDNVGIVNYTWSFLHNGSIVRIYGPAPEFTFWEDGNVVVTLNVTDAAGNWDESSVTVRVLNNPAINDDFPSWLFPLILIILLAIIIALLVLKKSDKREETPPPMKEPELPPQDSDSEMLKNIETRYAEGHISEETYNMLKEKYSKGNE